MNPQEIISHFGRGQLGDVLEKMKTDGTYELDRPAKYNDGYNVKWSVEILIKAWQPCGFSKSLQEIAEGGWEIDKEKFKEEYRKKEFGVKKPLIQILKQPQADLFEFLETLIK